MQENEFEKQMRMRMDELRLVPGEDVWKTVSNRIRDEKRRRRFLLILLAVTFLVGAAGIYFYNYNSKNSSSSEVAEVEVSGEKSSPIAGDVRKQDDKRVEDRDDVKTAIRTRSMSGVKRQGETSRIGETAGISKLTRTDGRYLKLPATGLPTNNPVYSSRDGDRTGTAKKETGAVWNDQNKSTIIRSGSPIAERSDPKEEAGNLKHSNADNELLTEAGKVESAEDKDNSGSKSSRTSTEAMKSPGQESIKSAEPKKEQDASPQLYPKKDSMRAAKSKQIFPKKLNSSNRNWNLGLTIFAGLSDNLSRIGVSPLADANFQNNPGLVTNTGILPVTRLTYQSRFSYAFGVYGRKRVTRTIGFSLGANYHFLSTASEVGSQVNSTRTFFDQGLASSATVAGYYVPGKSTRYTNKYYLLEFPLNVLIHTNRNQKRSVVLTMGVAPAYLFSSNALYANASQHAYYEDDSQFKKWLIQTQVGAQFTLINRDKFDITAGPEVRYGLNNMAKPAITATQHLFSAGLNLNVNLK